MKQPANPHFVCKDEFDPMSTEKAQAAQQAFFLASQWQLMWWKFKQHKLALYSGLFILLLYFSILICEFLAPYTLHSRHVDSIYSPPQPVHLFHEGEWVGPFVYGWQQTLDMDRLLRVYSEDRSKIYRIGFFCPGEEYRFWGVLNSDLHLLCVEEGGTLFLLGTDRLGRDMLSRIIYGTRISITIGLVGICLSMIMGVVIGSLAGYYGGWVDNLVQRVIEVIRSFPELPLWMALSAIIPVTWSPLWVFFGITLILALMDWTGLARAVRSKLLALREEDYASAAALMGASPPRIIRKHLLPGFFSHLIASATLSIPAMILGETALSFLGLGLRPPITSWGVLLAEAQNVNVVAIYPWLMLPVVPVICVILAFNFLGDGLRDAADPYKH
ncbi:ABC transporter permease [Aestuariirhabdus litorea]|uniref:ABC transporter permease n=1 Tax=Aestuariirhabdus litorea TaxID=2528527 RepID=A0A3P3VPP6_9GAMM|nr:ABC transporter permease [Aestuariirhabdus litorea]RRJ84751.1 ABC transporter permease [Aestuariirhabdus litorea]RWW97976.1 ABC transporter permease subunit [Endozoicomonadaceae bacterium GTF-13]